jgi:hypothetical protein
MQHLDLIRPAILARRHKGRIVRNTSG